MGAWRPRSGGYETGDSVQTTDTRVLFAEDDPAVEVFDSRAIAARESDHAYLVEAEGRTHLVRPIQGVAHSVNGTTVQKIGAWQRPNPDAASTREAVARMARSLQTHRFI